MNNIDLLCGISFNNVINKDLLVKCQNANRNYQCLALSDHKISDKQLEISLTIIHFLHFFINLF